MLCVLSCQTAPSPYQRPCHRPGLRKIKQSGWRNRTGQTGALCREGRGMCHCHSHPGCLHSPLPPEGPLSGVGYHSSGLQLLKARAPASCTLAKLLTCCCSWPLLLYLPTIFKLYLYIIIITSWLTKQIWAANHKGKINDHPPCMGGHRVLQMPSTHPGNPWRCVRWVLWGKVDIIWSWW